MRGIFPPRPALAAALGRHLSPLRSRFIQIVLFNKNMPNCICFAFFAGFLPYRRRRMRGIPGFLQGFCAPRTIQFVLFLQNMSNCISPPLPPTAASPARRGAAGGLSQITNTRRPPGEGQRAVYRRRQCAPPGAEKRTVCRKWQYTPSTLRRTAHGLPQMATRAARSERATRAARKKECIR